MTATPLLSVAKRLLANVDGDIARPDGYNRRLTPA